jgi:hypothetical protein
LGIAGTAVFCMATIFAVSWMLSYDGVRSAQRDAVRDRMPSAPRAFWNWLTRHRPEGTES